MEDEGKAGTVLVVDDDERWRRTLRDVLEGASYRVEVASSRGEALQVLAMERPDVILVDLVLEGSVPRTYEGLLLLEEIAASGQGQGMKAVLISGHDFPEWPESGQEQAAALGSIPRLKKYPWDRGVTLDTIGRAAGEARGVRARARDEEADIG